MPTYRQQAVYRIEVHLDPGRATRSRFVQVSSRYKREIKGVQYPESMCSSLCTDAGCVACMQTHCRTWYVYISPPHPFITPTPAPPSSLPPPSTHRPPPPAPTPYSQFPADWRAPLPKERPPTSAEAETAAAVAAVAAAELELQEKQAGRGGGGSADTPPRSEDDGLRTAAEVLQEATRVSASSGVGKKRSARIAEAPPGLEALQTENQRRRALPLSQLKRIKPKRR